MKRIEKYLPIAVDVIDDIILHQRTKVEPEWDNAICNFGAAIRTIGLYPAVYAFSNDSEKSKISRSLLMKCIIRIILLTERGVCENNQSLREYVKVSPYNLLVRRKVEDASIALKLALRLFIDNPKNEKEEEDEDN